MAKKNVVVCMPVQDSVQAQTTQCLIDLLAHRNVIGRVQCEGTLIHRARNHLLKSAVENFKEVTHVLFVDSDMVFNPDDLQKLLDSGKDVIGSICVERNVPFHPCFVPKDKDWSNMRKLLEGKEKGPMRVHSIGMGFTLISVKAIRKLWENEDKPFYFERGSDYGEDFHFCSLLRGQKTKIWVHCDSVVGHIAKLTVSLQHFSYNLMNNPDTNELKESIFGDKVQEG